MNLDRLTRVYAMMDNINCNQPQKYTNNDNTKSGSYSFGDNNREIQVTATSEVTSPPDKCVLVICVMNCKLVANEAKNSVARRVDYIMQTLHNFSIKDNSTQVYNTLTRDGQQYTAISEVRVEFTDFTKCQSVANVIVEKLDDNVRVSPPVVYHSPACLDNARRQASLLAVHNAKQKAREMARLVGLTIGRTLSMQDRGVTESIGSGRILPAMQYTSVLQQELSDKTVTVTARVQATFELKQDRKSREQS